MFVLLEIGQHRARVELFVKWIFTKFFERVGSIYRRIGNALYFSIYWLIFQYTFKYCSSFEMQVVYLIEYVRSFRERTTENESSKFCEVNFDLKFQGEVFIEKSLKWKTLVHSKFKVKQKHVGIGIKCNGIISNQDKTDYSASVLRFQISPHSQRSL